MDKDVNNMQKTLNPMNMTKSSIRKLGKYQNRSALLGPDSVGSPMQRTHQSIEPYSAQLAINHSVLADKINMSA